MVQLQVVLPMAGHGSRFKAAGYKVPKPLIPVGSSEKPMIEVVVQNLGLRGDYNFFVLSEHADAYSLRFVLKTITSPLGRCAIWQTPEVTSGQATSVLHVLDNLVAKGQGMSPVIVANSDQYVDGWHPGVFIDSLARHDPDGVLLTFTGTDPKWSFVRLCGNANHQNHVVEVAEKKPISDRAVVGVFYCKSVDLLRTAILSMMESESKRVNGEWYLAPAFNELIVRGLRVKQFPVPRMYGLGTPEDLIKFERLVEAGKVRV